MIRGIASSSPIATAVPLRARELADPETARPWNYSWMREGRWPDGRGSVCRSVGTNAGRSAGAVWCAAPTLGVGASCLSRVFITIGRTRRSAHSGAGYV